MILFASRWLLRAAVGVALTAAVGPLSFTSSPASAQVPALDQQAIDEAAHDEALRLLGEALGGAVGATQTDPTIPQILQALEENIESTQRIRELAVTSEVLTDEQIQQIATEIGEIADSFQQIADYAPEVFARRFGEIATLDAIGETIGFRIAEARARFEELELDNQRIQQDLLNDDALSLADVQKRRLTQQANNAEMQSLDAAMIAWELFAEQHGTVMDRMGDQTEELDIFFHALRENARVYRAAASTLNLAKSLREAIADLGTIETLEQMRGQLVQSWGDLMQIVDEVNTGLILTEPGM